MSPVARKTVKMVAERCDGTALWIFDTPRLDAVFGECNMTSEQQTAFTVEQQGFLEELMRVQHRNHEAAIHQLQANRRGTQDDQAGEECGEAQGSR